MGLDLLDLVFRLERCVRCKDYPCRGWLTRCTILHSIRPPW